MAGEYTGAIQTDVPTFTLLYSVDTVARRVAPPDRLAAALFVGGSKFTFQRNVRIPSKVDVETGEWLGIAQATGLFDKAVSSVALAWPVWQGGANRNDLGEGGITFLQGIWTALSNMVDVGDWNRGEIAIQDELIVGELPAEHEYAGRIGLVNLNDQATGSYFVVAHVQDVYYNVDENGDPTTPNGWVVLSNQNAGYRRTLATDSTTVGPTTLPPTTAAPTTAAPTTVAPTTV